MKYFLNANQQSGHNEHELHKETCPYIPQGNNRLYIGDFSSDSLALTQARTLYPSWRIDGCYFCCPTIHKM